MNTVPTIERIKEYLKGKDRVTVRGIAGAVSIGKTTAHWHIERLVNSGVLTRRGRGTWVAQ